MKCDVCIVGAGASGLMAAITSARRKAKTVLVETNTTAGRKLLHTGRGRCNLTHTGSIDDFVMVYGRYGRFLRHSLHHFSGDDTQRFFLENHLRCKVEKDGCVFPITDRATDVNRVLVDVVRRQGVTFYYGKRVKAVERQPDGFNILIEGASIACRSVIIATGGLSWPHTGSTGDGYGFARALGHSIVEPRPALVPLVTAEQWPAKLQGVGLKNVRLTASADGRRLSATGPMIFTSDGIGGPAVLDMSRHLTDILAGPNEPVPVMVDMLADIGAEELERLLIEGSSKNPKKELASVLIGLLPRTLSLDICSILTSGRNILANQLSKDMRRQLSDMIKARCLHIRSTRPIEEAMATRGGVSTEQIEPTTMESRICRGLFFAGEVIDVDGPCGGYNLQIAFSTGTLAGACAAKAIVE